MENRRRTTTQNSQPFGKTKGKKESGKRTYGEKFRRPKSHKNLKNAKDPTKGKSKKESFSKKNFRSKRGQKKSWKKNKLPRIVSDMQITGGKHRGKYLKTTASPKVKITARRIRESLFRILFRKVGARRFLDLCAGAGTVGIEAISRGALIGTFVERSAKMCNFIRKNLQSCGIKEGHGEIYETEAIPFLKRMKKRRRSWELIYFNPPYEMDYNEVLKYFEKGALVSPHGILAIEHHAEMFFPKNIGVMKRWKVIVRGETAVSFYERKI